MTLILSHPDCLAHQPPGDHPESPARLEAVIEALQGMPGQEWRSAPLASGEQLLLAHPAGYLDSLEKRHAGMTDEPLALDPDTWISKTSLLAGQRAAGAICAGIDAVMQQHTKRVFCAVRPPGHHAERATAMGFCLYSSVAIGALHAVAEYGLQRVAIVDFDVHQGNGTEDVVAGHSLIHYFASHQVPLYPFCDQDIERPENLNYCALPGGCDSAIFRQTWNEQLLPGLINFQPELMLISAGFDGHQQDPLAQCELQTEDYGWITEQLVGIADRFAQGRIVSSMEGGYALSALADSAVSHVQALG